MNSAARIASVIVAVACLFSATAARAATNLFFNAAQTMTVVSSNANAVTLASGDYEFTSSVDGYWAACAGCPVTGRFFSVFWPNGVQAQAITAGPLYGKGANITLKRADGKRFDLRAFTGKLLANTAATGAAFEIMPQLNGEDALNDPLMFDCSGYGGQSFPHTPALQGYDTYKIHLWVDWALTALTLIDTNASSPPATNVVVTTAVSPPGAGTASGGGTFTNGALVTVSAVAHPGFAFVNWTEGGTLAASSSSHTFTATASRTLVANFITNTPPVAYGGDFFQLTSQSLAINIADLMWNDYDPDGDPVTFVGASATTLNGLPLATNDTQVLIPTNALADSFTYTIADSHGGTATGTATISIITNAAGRVATLHLGTPGAAAVSFTGVPWYYYEAQRATEVTFTNALRTWPVQALPDGSIYVWDDFADLGGKPAQSFYRLRLIP